MGEFEGHRDHGRPGALDAVMVFVVFHRFE
jgi:hypothetical protein